VTSNLGTTILSLAGRHHDVRHHEERVILLTTASSSVKIYRKFWMTLRYIARKKTLRFLPSGLFDGLESDSLTGHARTWRGGLSHLQAVKCLFTTDVT